MARHRIKKPPATRGDYSLLTSPHIHFSLFTLNHSFRKALLLGNSTPSSCPCNTLPPTLCRHHFVEINSKLSSRPFKLLFLTLFRSFNTSSFGERQTEDICEVRICLVLTEQFVGITDTVSNVNMRLDRKNKYRILNYF